MIQNTVLLFDTGAATHVGKLRDRNEDGYLVRPDVGIWTVADGMGGHEDGQLASTMVVEALRSIEPPASASELLALCEERILDANNRLKEIAAERDGAILGSTVATLLVYDEHYACVWSGDSRVYLVRGGEIHQVSRDHTEVEELIAQGLLDPKDAKTWPRRNVVTRAIGVNDDPELEMRNGVLEPDDIFVICSDGLTAHVEDNEILTHVTAGYSQAACDSLIALTLERGAQDNVTVIVARYRPDETALLPEGEQPARIYE